MPKSVRVTKSSFKKNWEQMKLDTSRFCNVQVFSLMLIWLVCFHHVSIMAASAMLFDDQEFVDFRIFAKRVIFFSSRVLRWILKWIMFSSVYAKLLEYQYWSNNLILFGQQKWQKIAKKHLTKRLKCTKGRKLMIFSFFSAQKAISY